MIRLVSGVAIIAGLILILSGEPNSVRAQETGSEAESVSEPPADTEKTAEASQPAEEAAADVGSATPEAKVQQQAPDQVQIQSQTPGGQAQPVTVGKAGMNLQVLPIDDAKTLYVEMRDFTESLGVQCTYCHVIGTQQYGFADDSKKEKQIAREMIRLRDRVNQQLQEIGQKQKIVFSPQPVTCFTCHRGAKYPLRSVQEAEELEKVKP